MNLEIYGIAPKGNKRRFTVQVTETKKNLTAIRSPAMLHGETLTGPSEEEYEDISPALVGDDGKTYSVAQNDKGKDLVMMVGKKVEVKGTVKTKNGHKTMTVSSFKEIQ